MKKWFLTLIGLLMASQIAMAATKVPAKDVTVDTSTFGDAIPVDANTVQKALQAVNDNGTGGGGNPGGNSGEFQYNQSGAFAGTSLLTTNGSGIGINTASPTQTLDVNGTAKATTFSGSGSGLTNIPAGQLSGTTGVANGGTNLTAASDDNTMVGNGTTWQSKSLPTCLDSSGNHLNYDTSTNTYSCGTSGGLIAAGWTSNGTSIYATDITDKVGIGTTTPTELLEVNGNLKVTGVGGKITGPFGEYFDFFTGGDGTILFGGDTTRPILQLNLAELLLKGAGTTTGTGFVQQNSSGTVVGQMLDNGTWIPSFLRLPGSTTLPATCTVKDTYVDTDATTGQRLYLCESTDTWAVVGGGGGSGDITDVGTCTSGACFTSGSPSTSLYFNNATSGSIQVQAVTGALGTSVLSLPAATDTLVGKATTDTLTNKTLTSPIISTISNTGTLTLPTSTDTLVGKATTDVFTNKTFNTAGTGNVFQINGTGITAVSGTGSVVLQTSPTLTTPRVSNIVGGTGANSDILILATNNSSPITSAEIQFSGGNNGATAFSKIDQSGHYLRTGTAPTLSSCGTSPTITGTDEAMTVTPGAGATACTITFATAFSSTHCIVSEQTPSLTNILSYTESTTNIVLSQTGLAGNIIDIHCHGTY